MSPRTTRDSTAASILATTMTHPLRVAILQLRAHALADHANAWRELLARIDDAARDQPRWIVIPEGAYPASHLTSPDAVRSAGVRAEGDIVAELGERARTNDCYIAIGLPLRDAAALRNATLLITPEGRLASGATEMSPRVPWFAAGSGPAPAGPDGIPIGLVAGRDIEDPRVVASLRETDVRVVIATGPATAAARPGEGDPPGRRFAASARAVELGAWVVLPGLVGSEAGIHQFAGDAGVVDPGGRWQVRAPVDQTGIVTHTFDPDQAPGPRVVARTDLRPAPAPGGEPTPLQSAGAIALDRSPSVVALMEGLRAIVGSSAAVGVRLLVLPDLAGEDPRAITHAETLPLLEALSRETATVLAVGLAERADGATYKTVFAIDRGVTLAGQRQAHLTVEEHGAGFTPGDEGPRVVSTSAGSIGLLGGADALVPSLAPALRRAGARAITWCASGDRWIIEGVARARARESATPLLVAGGTSDGGGGFVIDLGGRVLAATPVRTTMCAYVERT